MMAQTNPDFIFAESSENGSGVGDANNSTNKVNHELDGELQALMTLNQQVPRLLSRAEESIVRNISNCLRNWHKPWKETFLADGREFKAVHELMENLLHYEDQITNSDSVLSSDRTSAIAQAVARLVDYGNAILNIDMIIRANDDASTELEPVNVTTIELFQAHTKANNLREKLLYDYFKKDKPNGIDLCDEAGSPTSGVLLSNLGSLQVPLLPNQASMQRSPTLQRSHRSSVGSNTSINTVSDGRRTPQLILAQLPTPLRSQVDICKFNGNNNQQHQQLQDTTGTQIELTHMTATIRSSAFLASRNSAMRAAFLPGILAKIESLLTVTTSDKVAACFELLDTLLDSIERLPNESRNKEVTIISTALLEPIVHKVFIDDRANLVEYQHAHWTTCLISILRLMTASDFNDYFRHFNNLADLGAFLKDYLFIVKRLLSPRDRIAAAVAKSNNMNKSNPNNSTYPECWIEMTLLACSTFLTSLTFLYQFLRQYFASNMQMWLSFIECLIHFILQDALKPDRFMLRERQRLLADDLRQKSAEYVWISWDFLNSDQKQQLLVDLIEPLLLASMTLHSKQRSILLPIFYDMVRCDYTSQYVTPRGSAYSSGDTTAIHSSRQAEFPSSDFLSDDDDDDDDGETNCNHNNGGDEDDDLESLPPIRQFASSNGASKTYESSPYLSYNRELSGDGTVLTKFTHLIVGKLNNLMIDLNLGDERFKIELCAAISGQLNPRYYNRPAFSVSTDTSQFRCMAKQTSDLIAEFMQICLDSRQANKLAYKHLYLLCLFKLFMFFRDKVDRIELYLSNLYRLCQLHHAAGRYVEAGYTLLELAKTLPWSDTPLESYHRNVTRYFQTPLPLTDYSSLKIFLYTTIAEYFDQGQLWEAAVPLCRELMDYYEFKTYEYIKLAEVLVSMSAYFTKITETGSRSNPEYFRVTFYGVGFPRCIRNTTMVYRGKPYEKLADFQATMLSKYPDARLLNSLSKPDASLLSESDARYLQINACLPVIDLRSKFGSSFNVSKMDESVLSYYRHNECDKFTFSRRVSAPITTIASEQAQSPVSASNNTDSFANMWRERTTLTTNTLPGMLPFFPVYLIETSIVSPIENAIEDLERTNDRLSCMVNRFRADKRHTEDVRLLGQLLLGVVDAAVNGGITKYEEAFFASASDSGAVKAQQQARFDGRNFEGLHVTAPGHGQQQFKQQQQQTGSLLLGAGVETPSADKVDKLKGLIAQQVPLLDEAIRLHRDRVADVMRPQHEHLEASYKKLKHHVMTKYYRYLPSDYSRSTIRSFRSLARSPNRSVRSDSRLTIVFNGSGARLGSKRMSDAGQKQRHQQQQQPTELSSANASTSPVATSSSSSIPYRPLSLERRSLPFLTGVPVVDRDVIKDDVTDRDLAHFAPAGGGVVGLEVGLERTRPVPSARSSTTAARSSGRTTTALLVASKPDGELDLSAVLPPQPHAAERVSSGQTYTRLLCNNRLNDREQADSDHDGDGNDDEQDDDDGSHLALNERRRSSDASDTKLVSL